MTNYIRSTQNPSQVVAIVGESGSYRTRLYVNCQPSQSGPLTLVDATATLVAKKATTLAGAQKQAERMLAAAR